MLFHQSRIFGEEALQNFYFGIEGCLRVIYYKHHTNGNFKINEVEKIIDEIFPLDGYSESLSSFYENRIKLVHPESRFDSDWSPKFSADEFMDNYEWILKLLYYAISGIVYEDKLM